MWWILISWSACEVLPNGKVIKLTQDFLRARYRESKRVEKLVTPGEINLYHIRRVHLLFEAHRQRQPLAADHQLPQYHLPGEEL